MATGLSSTLQRRRMRRRAGSRARAKYEQMRREWLRRRRKFWLAAVLVSLCLYALWVFVYGFAPGDHRWPDGFFAGFLVGVLIALRLSPPSSVATWEEGAWGEEATARQLVKLERDGWVVLHDLARGHGNFDHVVLGPNGVYCLNSKWSSYRLEPDGQGSLLGRHRLDVGLTMRIDGILQEAHFEAIHLKKIIEKRAGVTLWVQPVVVWWGDIENGGMTIGDVGVVRGEDLVARLRDIKGRPVKDFDRVVSALEPGRHRRKGVRTVTSA